MDIRPGEITDILKREIKEYDREIDVAETGTVLSVGDGIARVFGLERAMAGELVELPGGLTGLVLNLEEDNVGIAVMGETSHVKEATWCAAPAASSRCRSARRWSGGWSTRSASRSTARARSNPKRPAGSSSRRRAS
jgi:F-type H+-transporting ATPase subunit alpha